MGEMSKLTSSPTHLHLEPADKNPIQIHPYQLLSNIIGIFREKTVDDAPQVETQRFGPD